MYKHTTVQKGVRSIKHLFLSYSSKDLNDAEALRSMFEQGGVKVWMANHDIGAGEDFASSIQDAIDKCSCFVMLLTEDAQKSPWVPKELDAAISSGKPIVPVQTKPVSLSQGFKFNLINTQIFTLPYVDANTKEAQCFISAIKNHMNGRPRIKLHKNAGVPVNKKAIVIPAVIFVAILLIIFFFVFSEIFSNLSDIGEDIEETTAKDVLKNNVLPTPSSSDKNQIPEFFEDEISALKYADGLTKTNKTKTVKVGEYVSLSTVWSDAVTYSQDASIAVGEGPLVKGVSVGTTYVIIAMSENVSSAFYIIVQE